jgi:hypothetical protein
MGKWAWLAQIGGLLATVAKDVAPGVTTEADTLFHELCKFVKLVAHPNTVAFKVADAAIQKAAELGL